jgi:hypothetical protein
METPALFPAGCRNLEIFSTEDAETQPHENLPQVRQTVPHPIMNYFASFPANIVYENVAVGPETVAKVRNSRYFPHFSC